MTVAESEGFEPSVPCEHTRLAGEHLRPLGQLSSKGRSKQSRTQPSGALVVSGAGQGIIDSLMGRIVKRFEPDGPCRTGARCGAGGVKTLRNCGETGFDIQRRCVYSG